jgi:hypothetical protein
VNVRFALLSDVFLRAAAVAGLGHLLLVAGFTGRSIVGGALLGALVALDLWQYARIFVVGRVYDPVTLDLARALGFFR